jgi:sugar lactone lactonase YvrE
VGPLYRSLAPLIAVSALACHAIDTIPTEPPPSAEGPAATLFVSDYRAGAVFRYDGASGRADGALAAIPALERPSAVALGPGGQLYAAGFGRGEIARYDAATGARRDVFFWDTRLLEEPVSLLFRGDDLIAIGNDTHNAVVLTPSGRVQGSFGSPTMRAAQDAVLADAETLIVATEQHPALGAAIQVWSIERGELIRAFGAPGEISAATGIALGPDGTLYASDRDRGRIVRFELATGRALEPLVVAGLEAPTRLQLGPDGALYALDAVGVHGFALDTGAHRGLVVAVGDGQLVRPSAFGFVTPAALGASLRQPIAPLAPAP